MPPLPAHQTKTLTTLHYELLPTLTITLTQPQSPTSPTTGSTLWLGAQLLSLYLLHLYPSGKRNRGKAIDLGSGTGLTALALAVAGWDVVATDVEPVLSGVLKGNVEANKDICAGAVTVRELDWFKSLENDLDFGNEIEGEFELVVSADTVYEQSLVRPLIATFRKLADGSCHESGKKRIRKVKCLLAVEVRDTQIVEMARSCAEGMGFVVGNVREERLEGLMRDAGWQWEKEDWDGIEVWELRLKLKLKDERGK